MKRLLLLAIVWPTIGWADIYGFAGGAFLHMGEEGDIEVPDVVGLTTAAADTALEAETLDTGTVTQRCSDELVNVVVSQNPIAGVFVDTGSLVDLVASNGVLCEGKGLSIVLDLRIIIN